jgi:N utilization substance protein B
MQGIRRQARGYALQLLYQVEQTQASDKEALGRFWLTVDASNKAREFAMTLATATLDNLPRIDRILAASLEHWKLGRLSVVVRNILRLAVCEMLVLRLNPHPIVIDEAVELTRSFMDEESVAFVNSVLEKCHAAAGADAEPAPDKRAPRADG